MCKIIVAMILLSACRLGEEPLQQTKGFARGDLVFDAQNISKTAVAQCQDDSCRTKTPLSSAKLHQVSLSDKPIEGALQFNNLHISFEAGDKIYTCTRLSAPMGKMTLLQRGDDNKYCYIQAKAKDYVQQFALACLQEQDWHLVAGIEAEALQKFTCEKDSIRISSACFFDEEDCGTENWPEKIKEIYDVKNAESPEPTAKETRVTAKTKLADVVITAEWKLSTDGVICTGIDEEGSFERTTDKKTKDFTIRNGDRTVGDVTADFNCSIGTSPLTLRDYPAEGVCALMLGNRAPENINDCGKDSVDHIKITFAPKG